VITENLTIDSICKEGKQILLLVDKNKKLFYICLGSTEFLSCIYHHLALFTEFQNSSYDSACFLSCMQTR